MEFDEPDLEDLIQSDLRTEMNRILSQSEVDEFEANSSEGLNSTQELSLSSISSSVTDIPCSSRMMRAQDETVKKEISADNSWPEGLIVSGDFDMIDCSMIQALTQNKMSFSSTSSSSHLHPEISGHFSMESYPDFGGEMPLCPQSVAEHNDLSSLTWLTTVDVQALQKLSEQGAAMSMPMVNALGNPGNQTYCSQPQVTSMDRSTCNITCEMNTVNPEPSTMIQSTATVHESCLGSNVNVVNSLPPQPACSGTSSSGAVSSYMRYTPIQPNCAQADRRYAAQQRYRLQPHPSTAAHQYDGGRIGPHRYMPSAMVGHPYPPPPYAPRGGYVHGASLMHSRFHSHTHPQKVFPKPVYSYSCLIAMALTDSKTGCLPVSDIYSFMMENYPYFKTAPDGWKNSVRHNLSLNKCFEKVEKPNGTQRKGCLWALNPAKINKMKEEVQKWKRKDPDAIRRSMSNPEQLDRELEEMRRADEEAARRRMLSLSSHGLTTSAVHPHSHPQQLHHSHHAGQFHLQHSAIHQHLNSPTAGPSSLPTTPIRRQGQHFSPELAQHHFALALARSASQPPLGHNPFDLSPMSSSSPHGVPGTPNSLNVGSNNNNNSFPSNSSSDKIILSSGSGRTAFFASPQSSSSNSSGNASLLGTFTEVTSSLPEVGNEFTDIELDASLADLAALQDSFWDGALTSQASASSEIGDVFASSEEKQTPSSSSAAIIGIPTTTITGSHTVLPPLIRVLSTKTQDGSPDSTVFDSSTNQRADNFSHDLTQFANNNNKSVMLL